MGDVVVSGGLRVGAPRVAGRRRHSLKNYQFVNAEGQKDTSKAWEGLPFVMVFWLWMSEKSSSQMLRSPTMHTQVEMKSISWVRSWRSDGKRARHLWGGW